MFQICLTSEKPAALRGWQQKQLFFSGSFLHGCCMQSKAFGQPDLLSLVTLFLTQAKISLAEGLTFNQLSTRSSKGRVCGGVVLYCQEHFQPIFPKPLPLHRVIMTQVQNPAVSTFVETSCDWTWPINPLYPDPSAKLSYPEAYWRYCLTVLSVVLLRVYLIPSSRSLIKTLNSLTPVLSPGECHWWLVTNCIEFHSPWLFEHLYCLL